MKPKLQFQNRDLIHLIVFIVITVVFFPNCNKNPVDSYAEFSELSPDVWIPQSLKITDVSLNEKKLEWDYQITNIEGFNIDRKIGNKSWVLEYRTLPKEVRIWNDEEVIPRDSTVYYYRICAYAGMHKSGYEEDQYTITFPAPDSVTSRVISEKECKISWVDASIGEHGFKIDYKLENNDWNIGYAIVSANNTSYLDTNVYRTANVQYRVYGFYNDLESKKVEVNSIFNLPPPENLNIIITSINSSKLDWEKKSQDEDGFIVEKKVENEPWKQIGKTKSSTFIDNELDFGNQIHYRVCAYIGDYITSYSESSIQAILQPPVNLTIEYSNLNLLLLNWYNYNNIGESFIIQRKNEGANWEQIGISNISLFEDQSFNHDTYYQYRVCSNILNFSSDWVTLDFLTLIPSPHSLSISASSINSITLSWNYNFTGHQGFKIDRKVDNEQWAEEYSTIQSSQYSFTDDNVDLEIKNYTYKIYTYVDNYNSISIKDSIETVYGAIINGGMVFYIDGNGNGMVCSKNSGWWSESIWGCYGYMAGGTTTTFGSGITNTEIIEAACGINSAAGICSNLELNGYNDWYLPSLEEIETIYINLILTGIIPNNDNHYWSSSEGGSFSAYNIDFGSGSSITTEKYNDRFIIAIRNFQY